MDQDVQSFIHRDCASAQSKIGQVRTQAGQSHNSITKKSINTEDRYHFTGRAPSQWNIISWFPSLPWTRFLCLATCIGHWKLSPQILQRCALMARCVPRMWSRRVVGFLSCAEQMWHTQDSPPSNIDCWTAESRTFWTTLLYPASFTDLPPVIIVPPAPAWYSDS